MWRQLDADYLIQTSSSMCQDNNAVLVSVLSACAHLVLLLSVWGLHNRLGSVWSVFVFFWCLCRVFVFFWSFCCLCWVSMFSQYLWGVSTFSCYLCAVPMSSWCLCGVSVFSWCLSGFLWFPITAKNKHIKHPVVQRLKTRVVQTRSLRDAFQPGFLTYQIDKAFTWVKVLA